MYFLYNFGVKYDLDMYMFCEIHLCTFTSSGIRIEPVTHYTCLYGDVTIMLPN